MIEAEPAQLRVSERHDHDAVEPADLRAVQLDQARAAIRGAALSLLVLGMAAEDQLGVTQRSGQIVERVQLFHLAHEIRRRERARAIDQVERTTARAASTAHAGSRLSEW